MNRKEFIRTCGFACLSGSTLLALLESCASTNYYAKTIYNNNKIIISKSEFIENVKNRKIKRKHVFVNHDKYNFPICVFKLNEEIYTALLMECTHKGCELIAQGDFLVCPCHGSEFTNHGQVLNPPAEQNLKSFKTIVDTDNIYLYV